MRIDKFLCDMGAGTRKEVKRIIKDGRVKLNGNTVKKGDVHLNENEDVVLLDENEISYRKYIYLMLNKPKGYVSANEDKRFPVVVDLVDEKYKMYDLFCVGRLDIDTTGILILTNDGDFAHHLTSPKHHVEKKYYALISGEVTADDVKTMKEGVTIDGGYKCLPAELEILNAGDGESEIYLTISEGKFHQVKRMFEAVGKKVVELKRVKMGFLELDATLEQGGIRELTCDEVKNLYF